MDMGEVAGAGRESFTAWASARRESLLRTAVLLTGDLGRAEDLVQEALTKVALRWDRLAHEHPEAYARRILVRDNVSRWRRTRHEVVTDRIPEHGTEVAVTGAERRMVLLEALATLTPRQRAVLVLRYLEDLSEAEIARTLDVSAGTVKSTAHLALRRLRESAPHLADDLKEDV